MSRKRNFRADKCKEDQDSTYCFLFLFISFYSFFLFSNIVKCDRPIDRSTSHQDKIDPLPNKMGRFLALRRTTSLLGTVFSGGFDQSLPARARVVSISTYIQLMIRLVAIGICFVLCTHMSLSPTVFIYNITISLVSIYISLEFYGYFWCLYGISRGRDHFGIWRGLEWYPVVQTNASTHFGGTENSCRQ